MFKIRYYIRLVSVFACLIKEERNLCDHCHGYYNESETGLNTSRRGSRV